MRKHSNANDGALWSRRRLLKTSAGVAGWAASTPLLAEPAFPDRPVRLFVGYPPGGFTDIVIRIVSNEAAKKLGQPIIIENRPGAAGVLSFVQIKNATADGYTIGAVNPALWRQPVIEDVAYDPATDFTYIINLVDAVHAVVVANDAPFKTWNGLLAWGRAHQDEVNYGVVGLGQTGDLLMKAVSERENVKWQAIGYKGSADIITALLGRQITFSVDAVIATSAQVKAGQARYLTVAAEDRMKSFPDVPTMNQLGYAIDVGSTLGIGGPANMPPERVRVLHDAFKFALEQPDVIAALEKSDQSPHYMATDEFGKFVTRSSALQRDLLTRYGFAKKR